MIDKNDISICFTGSLYAKDEWNSLLDALDILSWKIKGKNVVLHHYGNFPHLGAKKHKNVIYMLFIYYNNNVIIYSDIFSYDLIFLFFSCFFY